LERWVSSNDETVCFGGGPLDYHDAFNAFCIVSAMCTEAVHEAPKGVAKSESQNIPRLRLDIGFSEYCEVSDKHIA
jgi:hypothetical protein